MDIIDHAFLFTFLFSLRRKRQQTFKAAQLETSGAEDEEDEPWGKRSKAGSEPRTRYVWLLFFKEVPNTIVKELVIYFVSLQSCRDQNVAGSVWR